MLKTRGENAFNGESIHGGPSQIGESHREKKPIQQEPGYLNKAFFFP